MDNHWLGEEILTLSHVENSLKLGAHPQAIRRRGKPTRRLATIRASSVVHHLHKCNSVSLIGKTPLWDQISQFPTRRPHQPAPESQWPRKHKACIARLNWALVSSRDIEDKSVQAWTVHRREGAHFSGFVRSDVTALLLLLSNIRFCRRLWPAWLCDDIALNSLCLLAVIAWKSKAQEMEGWKVVFCESPSQIPPDDSGWLTPLVNPDWMADTTQERSSLIGKLYTAGYWSLWQWWNARMKKLLAGLQVLKGTLCHDQRLFCVVFLWTIKLPTNQPKFDPNMTRYCQIKVRKTIPFS